MATVDSKSRLSQDELIDLGFLDQRFNALNIAAFLDRLDRTSDDRKCSDYRVAALKDALKILTADESQKARKIQMLLSDPSTNPIKSIPADGIGATGAFDPEKRQ